MSEFAEAMKMMREHGRDKRAERREHGAKVLRDAGVYCDVLNGGAHLVVQHEDRVVDYWPGTGRFIERDGGPANGRGLRPLLRALGVAR